MFWNIRILGERRLNRIHHFSDRISTNLYGLFISSRVMIRGGLKYKISPKGRSSNPFLMLFCIFGIRICEKSQTKFWMLYPVPVRLH